MFKNFIQFIIFFALSFWLGCIVLTDFVVIRTLFSEMNDFFKAGFIGVKLFSKLNFLELIFATVILLSEIFLFIKSKKTIHFFLLFFILYSITFFNFIHLTPKLSDLTYLWYKADLMGLVGINGIKDIQQEHQFYHELYIMIDSVKIFILTASLSIFAWNSFKKS